jgi:hypothetical protein
LRYALFSRTLNTAIDTVIFKEAPTRNGDANPLKRRPYTAPQEATIYSPSRGDHIQPLKRRP